MGLNEEEEEFESNLRAAQRLESLRAAEAADEDEEFEKAFKSMMQVNCICRSSVHSFIHALTHSLVPERTMI